ncbi:glycoside hydrolase family 2 protein [Xylariales sp. AK1849]|nr:glycoside hydrolase family 2 protein [Xylariales sp. AK1849]
MSDFGRHLPSLERIELKKGWQFRQVNGKPDDPWRPIRAVPTDVYRELLANNEIADPFEDINELSVRWVADKDWVYKAQFEVRSATVGSSTTTDLVFEGLDTFATVSLNGTEILKSDNMFLSHRVNVSSLLKSDNVLEIVFRSAKLRGRELLQEHSKDHRFIARQTEDGRIPVRKAQYHWGWDWGPILIGTSGPWRPVYLETYTARVDDFWIQSCVDDELQLCSGSLNCRTAGAAGDDKVLLSLSFNGQIVFQQVCEVASDGVAKCSFEVRSPKLWYPVAYGKQDRYELAAVLSRDGQDLDKKSKLIGFRKVELIQDADEFGKSFYFRINGIDVFAGGSCWIPGSSYLSELSRPRYYDWIKLLIEGKQTMIRVWGGGIYEDDAFYDACDEFGILVWQDFCFACGSYPTYPSFMKSVECEARQNVRRLRSHPSLVVWAGSNEDYQVQERYKLDYDYEDKDPESWLKSSFPARYYYEYLLPTIVNEEDPGTAYHPTSPWGDGKDTADPTVGDMHQWNIWHGTMEKYQYAQPLGGRFISEFGMEAYPHLETTRSAVTTPEQQYPGSVTMDFHNKAIGHERRLMSYMVENFQVKYDLASFTHLSQMVQSEAMSYAYKTWRREWGRPGARKCAGVLVWQLNDCWPTMSWAVVDYYLVKKPAFYSIARALEPITVGILRTCRDWSKTYMNAMLELGHVDPTLDAREDTKYEVWIANSWPRYLEAQAKVRFVSIRTGRDVLCPAIKTVMVAPNATTEVFSDSIEPLRSEFKDTTKSFNLAEYDPYIIHATLLLDGQVVSTDTAWPQPLKYLDFSDRNLSFKVTQAKDRITISAEKPVKGLVFEETRAMKLSANNFDVVPDEDISVEVNDVSLDELRFTYVGAPSASMTLPIS